MSTYYCDGKDLEFYPKSIEIEGFSLLRSRTPYMLVLFIFIWIKSQRIGNSFVCHQKPGRWFGTSRALPLWRRCSFGAVLSRPEAGLWEEPGLWGQILVRPALVSK